MLQRLWVLEGEGGPLTPAWEGGPSLLFISLFLISLLMDPGAGAGEGGARALRGASRALGLEFCSEKNGFGSCIVPTPAAAWPVQETAVSSRNPQRRALLLLIKTQMLSSLQRPLLGSLGIGLSGPEPSAPRGCQNLLLGPGCVRAAGVGVQRSPYLEQSLSAREGGQVAYSLSA